MGPYLPGVSVVLVATHWDAFRDQDAELRKVMARALRFVAHTHGCHLCYVSCGPGGGGGAGHSGGAGDSGEAGRTREAGRTGGAGSGAGAVPAGGGRGGAAERQATAAFRALVSGLAFAGPERLAQARGVGPPQLDHAGPLLVPSGCDRLRDIGRPRGAEGLTVEDGLRSWREVFEKVFPRPPGGEAAPGAEPAQARMDLSPYPEVAVDAAAARKADEMAEAHRQQQAQAAARRRLQAQRAARAQQRSVAAAE